eukprot:6976621-Ditylum_brightwellii.AAC.1
MSEYFGRSLRLRKTIYGLILSGKLWVTGFPEWLLTQGFNQSKAEPSYFILYKDETAWLRMIFYVDDMLCFGSNAQGNAHWFLTMRIHQHKDGSYSLDQTRYTSNIIHKYNPKFCPWGLPQQGPTQASPDYVCPKENRPSSNEEEDAIKENIPGLDFRSAVYSLLYLAFGARSNILFIICKLAKACSASGMKDFEALVWLF